MKVDGSGSTGNEPCFDTTSAAEYGRLISLNRGSEKKRDSCSQRALNSADSCSSVGGSRGRGAGGENAVVLELELIARAPARKARALRRRGVGRCMASGGGTECQDSLWLPSSCRSRLADRRDRRTRFTFVFDTRSFQLQMNMDASEFGPAANGGQREQAPEQLDPIWTSSRSARQILALTGAERVQPSILATFLSAWLTGHSLALGHKQAPFTCVFVNSPPFFTADRSSRQHASARRRAIRTVRA